MTYIGIDPGKNGGLAILNGEEVQTFRYDRDTYRCVLSDLRGEKAVCCLEHVGVMPKNGSVSMFHFGENFGWLQGTLEAFGVPYELVKPQKWKRNFRHRRQEHVHRGLQAALPRREFDPAGLPQGA